MCRRHQSIPDEDHQSVNVQWLCACKLKGSIYITPLLKNPTLDKSDINSYRPISNLSVLSKLLEQAVCTQLVSYHNINSLTPRNQSAYHRRHSTETALAFVFSELISALDDGNLTLMALLDLSAAVDCVDHNILLSRLNITYGIGNMVRSWVSSYLSGRTQSVWVDGTSSHAETMQYGVPQGSVMGLLLFLLYTADLDVIVTNQGLMLHFYADKSQLYLYCRPDQIQQLQVITIDCIMDIDSWVKSNRLQLNRVKAEFVWVATPCWLHYFNDNPFILGNTIVKPTTNARNFGVMRNQDFSMVFHINKLFQSCFYSLRHIQSIWRSLTFDATRKLICSLIYLCVDYCNSLFAWLLAQSIDLLQSILNSSAHLACSLHKYDHITPTLYDRLHWQQGFIYKLCLLTFKGLQGEALPYIIELCLQACQQHRVMLPQALLCCWQTAYRPADSHRFLKKGIRLRRSVGLEQPAFWTETVTCHFVQD